MTFYDTYIGDLDEPVFKWEGGNWDGNLPAPIGPLFPPYRGSYLFGGFFEWVKSCRCEYRQTDWGRWVAKVTKKQIQEFIVRCYGADESYNDQKKMLWWQFLC